MKVLVGLAFETNAQDYGLLIMRAGYTNLMHPPMSCKYVKEYPFTNVRTK